MSEPLVIVGASYAGLNAGLSARAAGHDGAIVLIGDEATLPYQRPPLSKGFMLGKVAESSLPIRPQQTLDNNRIEFLPGTRATAIDRTRKTVETSNGRRIPYGRLILATGCRARTLPAPGADLDGVCYLRTLEDARKLREHANEAQSVAIVGGGFIGLEVAASLASLGKSVTVIEAQDRLLARAVPPAFSEFLSNVHRGAGVRILFGTTVRQMRGEAGKVRAVELSDGSECAADLVLVGIGAIANTELAAQAGLACDDGIVVDTFARTSDPLITAAGDCTRFPTRFAARPVRLESVQNAQDQARTAAVTATGTLKAYDAVPWFWSDQYDLKLQMVGLSHGHDRMVMRGSTEERRFALFYFKNNALIAIETVNRAADHMAGRHLLGSDLAVTAEQIADPGFDLAGTVKAHQKATR
jgi:3-phenylpropionate/trans-cinnamate dioxygenase ferredoxin reductase subunit